MTSWLRRLFWLAVIAGAAFAAWTAVQRRNEPASVPARSPSPAPAAPPPPRPAPRTAPEPAADGKSQPRWREPVDGACPVGYPIKVAKSGIYHVPGGRSYDRTTAERCYVDADDAEADGYRRAKA